MPVAWVAIYCSVMVAYYPALHGGFLWDDDGHICAEGLRSLHGLGRIWTDLGATQQYYPVLHSVFWLEYQCWGSAVGGYHWMNLLLHAGSACLLTAIVRRLALPGGILAGLIFALHPVCVESVAWISEQKNTLSMFLYLGSALTYLRFDDERKPINRMVAFGLFALALLTKSVTATLPVVLLIIIWWRRGRLRWKEDVLPLGHWLVLGTCCGLFTAWVENWIIGAHGAVQPLAFDQRFLVAGRVVWFYLGKLVWPVGLIFNYPRWTIDLGAWWQYLFPAGLLICGSILWVIRGINRGPLAVFLLYLASLFPVLGFLDIYPFVFSYIADHFQYFACVGIIVPIAALLEQAVSRLRIGTSIGLPLVLGATLGLLTWQQARLYRDAQTLYAATLERNPDCWLAHNNLGKILAATPSTVPDAIAHFEAALRLKPDQADIHFNLANAYAKIPDRRSDAEVHYQETLRLNPEQAGVQNNYAILLAKNPAQLMEAIAHFEIAIKLDPAFAAAHSNLGTAWSRLPGHAADAITHYQAALRLNPSVAQVYFDLANIYAKNSQWKTEAISTYEAAIRLNPDYAEAHFNLANLLRTVAERRQEAVAHYQRVLQIRPEWDAARRILEHEKTAEP